MASHQLLLELVMAGFGILSWSGFVTKMILAVCVSVVDILNMCGRYPNSKTLGFLWQ